MNGCRTLREKIEEAELELSKLHFKFKIDKDNKAIEKIKSNSKHFYTFVRNKVNKKNSIGPFVDKKRNIIKPLVGIYKEQNQTLETKQEEENIFRD